MKEKIKQFLSERYLRRNKVQWDRDNRLKVLIECWPGFSESEWVETLGNSFAEREQFIQLRFVHNSLERYILTPEMEVYVSTWLTPELISRSPQLRWVNLAMGGVEFLADLKNVPSIKITTAAGVSANGIAEHIIGLMIALDRRFDIAFLRQQQWQWKQAGILDNIRGLRGRTLGIVGLGRNGQALIGPARTLGMRVIGLDTRQDLVLDNIEHLFAPVEIIEFLKMSDFVVLCVPLTHETISMIGQRELQAMRPTAYLINIARGKIVDDVALARALRRREIAGAALDTLSTEPPSFFHPLRGCPNLLVTPHVAGNVYTYREEIRTQFVRNLKLFIEGKKLEGMYQHV